MEYINSILQKLSEKHLLHIEMYGDNTKRLTGHHETSDKDHFTSGTGDRTASVRIPSFTTRDGGKGYIEDRRPASDIDPYVAIATVIDTCINNGEKIGDLYKAYIDWKEWRKTEDIQAV